MLFLTIHSTSPWHPGVTCWFRDVTKDWASEAFCPGALLNDALRCRPQGPRIKPINMTWTTAVHNKINSKADTDAKQLKKRGQCFNFNFFLNYPMTVFFPYHNILSKFMQRIHFIIISSLCIKYSRYLVLLSMQIIIGLCVFHFHVDILSDDKFVHTFLRTWYNYFIHVTKHEINSPHMYLLP